MGRSGYSEDCENWSLIRWRGAVASAIRGKRGQSFLKEMLAALDALEKHELITEELEADGAVCAIGAIGKSRGIEMAEIDPYDRSTVAGVFGVSEALAAEIMYENDEGGPYSGEIPEQRFARMRRWIESLIVTASSDPA